MVLGAAHPAAGTAGRPYPESMGNAARADRGPARAGLGTAHGAAVAGGYLLQVQSWALARQPPPPAALLQARPRTARPLGARVASPSRSARTPFTQTFSTPVASCCGCS